MKSSPRIIELVGLAGAGKTTLTKTLGCCNDQIRVEQIPYYRRIRYLAFFARNTLLCLPMWFRFNLKGNGRRLTGQEFAAMVILSGWHRLLKRPGSDTGQVIVIDQGPVSMLTILWVDGPETLRSSPGKEWWIRTCKQWANALDELIWLDAANATLLERIRARDTWHKLKEEPDTEALECLGRYRETYGQVISLLTATNDDLKVLAFDTAREPLDGLVDNLLLEFGLKESGA
jgi:hypothetical protein